VPIMPPDGRPDKADGMSRITVPAVMEVLSAEQCTASVRR
jgi:hypothetical protein